MSIATLQAILSSIIIFFMVAAAHEHHAESKPHAKHDCAHAHAKHKLEHKNPHRNLHPAHQAEGSGPWKDAHATFYGPPEGTLGGACGYEDCDKKTYGPYTTALSEALFKGGKTCGACYEIKCGEGSQSQWCKPGQPTVHVTATDLCPGGGEGWCNTPKEHFDMSQPAFLKIAEYKGGIVPVKYRKVACKREGGIRFKITGHQYFNMVGITNVGGAGDIIKVEVKVGMQWTALKHNYGDRWDTNAALVGKKLTFRITLSDGKTIVTEQAAPQDWQFGQTFQDNRLAT